MRVEPDPSAQPGVLRFSVCDTGIGIPQEKLEAIFDAFTQGDPSTSRKYGGTGLGLAISKRIVELMDGRIWAESGPGAGAAFHFTARFGTASKLAAAGPAEGHAALPVAWPGGPIQGLRILVADDSEENRFLVGEYLKELGCHLDFVENGQAAVGKFCSGAYDLVLMDLQMPVMDGYAATRRIRGWEEEQKRSLIPIIALTASALETEMQKALDAGCTAYLRKPVRLLTLIEAVGKYAAKPAVAAAPLERIRVRADSRLRAVIPGYLTHRRDDVANIRQALARLDYDSIRQMGHKMSGTGAGYGFPRITEIGQGLERAAREGNAPAIRECANELSRFIDQVEVVG